MVEQEETEVAMPPDDHGEIEHRTQPALILSRSLSHNRKTRLTHIHSKIRTRDEEEVEAEVAAQEMDY